ncbi:MAG TPA: chromate resistance protein ChrB domain-containing protein [Candidatus Acidoferrum sp.]|nr:chromate resistance protein ChrB domain-containing protein [Candidatus Acidoferrum sp.]
MIVRIREAEWLLLTFTLPTKRASQRVEIWRKLQRFGTVPLGNSGYLLPNNPSNEERFQWLATSIRKYGGDASVVHVESIDNLSRPQLVGRFAEARTKEYQELIRELHVFSSTRVEGKGEGRLNRLRNRFQEIVEVDFFNSPLQKRVEELLEKAAMLRERKLNAPNSKINPEDYRDRVWVTRPRPGVDRCASAWLIRNFIDGKARFTFAPEDRVPAGVVPFDMFHAEGFGHRGDDCTFETLEKLFHVRDPKVALIGQMIHDADLLDDRFGRNEAYGVDEILKGWARQRIPDDRLLERGMELIDALYSAQKQGVPNKRRKPRIRLTNW